MHTRFIEQLSKLACLLTLVLSLILGVFPQVAWADKAEPSVLFDPSGTGISVVTVYETTADTQLDAISDVLKSSKSLYKKMPGFGSFLMLKSEDSTRVITIAQWESLDAYNAALAASEESTDSKKSKEASSFKSKKGKVAITPARTVVFEIDGVQVPEGLLPGIQGSKTLVQFSEVILDSVDSLPKVLTGAEALLVGKPATYPAPRSVVLFRGVDTPEIALLADWGYSANQVSDVSKLPVLPVSEMDALEPDQHLYELVKVIAAKPEKTKKEKEED
jgi:heme-degrading monooxygenase HmoA